MPENSPNGKLILLATPLGNLGEFPPRAVEVLKTADKILCENTPSALRLMTVFGITGKTVRAVHEANEGAAAESVAREVSEGQMIVYMSEAGAPCISDPGFRLVRACRRINLRVEAIGISSAFLNALIISGLPTDEFFFCGFPPPKSVGRKKFFEARCSKNIEATVIFYESCHRLLSSISDLKEIVGPERFVCLAGELTKLHESVQTAPVGGLKLPENPKGEWVVCVAKEGYRL